MSRETAPPPGDLCFARKKFDIRTLEDEIAVDQLCSRFLQSFFHHLVETEKTSPAEAARLARGADHFLREFIIPEKRENIFVISCERVRQFAGNWYIVRTLEPNPKELCDILDGIKTFYRFCSQSGKTDFTRYEAIVHHCNQLDYYRKRIDSFWAIEDDGYFSWNAECPLES
ncbi:MAG: hypothetical protein JXK94_01840 [Deltaproteobacteria bacterium]|nr:hypothetical protein [Deltaproteobacteria bacterium]